MNVVARSFAPRCKQLEEVDGTRRESAGDKTQRGETRNCAGLRGFICPGCGRPAGNCMLEVESPQDAKVRLEWKGASSSELTQLIRAFSVKPLFRRFCGRRLPERLLAYIIEDATLIKVPAEKVTRIHVRFKAGKAERLTTLNPKSSAQQIQTRPEVVKLVDQLLDDYVYSEIADILNQRGSRPGASARPGRALHYQAGSVSHAHLRAPLAL
jgi:hypothetical protein